LCFKVSDLGRPYRLIRAIRYTLHVASLYRLIMSFQASKLAYLYTALLMISRRTPRSPSKRLQ